MTQKLGNGFEFKKKACFVCGSLNHLIKDYNFYENKMVGKSVLNNGCCGYGSKEVRPGQGIFDSGCSRHMTGNKFYLSDYQDIDGGFVAFARIAKGGKITGKRTPQQNGVAERKNRTLIEAARTMLADSKLPTNFWKKTCLEIHETTWVSCYNPKYLRSPRTRVPTGLFDIDTLTMDKLERNASTKGDMNGQGEAADTNRLNIVSLSVNIDAHGNNTYMIFTLISATGSFYDNLGGSICDNAATLPSGAYNDEDVGAEADHNNLETTMNVNPIPTTRIHKDHPKNQIIRDINLATQTRRITKISEEHDMINDWIIDVLTASRPDIMFVVCACARFQVTPKVSHLHAVKRIFRYLKGQLKLGLWYPKDSPFDLEAFSDSDYAGASLDRKSTKRDLLTKAFDVSRFNFLIASIGLLNLLIVCSTAQVYLRLDERECDIKQKWVKEKTNRSEGFHQIVDFLNASHIRFALSKNPTIYDSHIKQFWQTATVNTLDNEEQEITTTVDGHVKTVTIASVRKYLKLADVGGLSSLPNTKFFDQLSLMGYAITSDKLTFQKGHFSPQW
ncbi:uncharacterized mitochondrial protein-like protein, partial [Tanacetum coccineum]